jgi:hypothetical protein
MGSRGWLVWTTGCSACLSIAERHVVHLIIQFVFSAGRLEDATVVLEHCQFLQLLKCFAFDFKVPGVFSLRTRQVMYSNDSAT